MVLKRKEHAEEDSCEDGRNGNIEKRDRGIERARKCEDGRDEKKKNRESR